MLRNIDVTFLSVFYFRGAKCKNFEKHLSLSAKIMVVVEFAEGLDIHYIAFPHIHNVIERIWISGKMFSSRFV